MTPAAQLEFLTYCLENGVITPEEGRLLLMYSGEWTDSFGTSDELAEALLITLNKYGLTKESIDELPPLP